MGPVGYPETSVRNYRYSLRNNPEERSSRAWTLRRREKSVACAGHQTTVLRLSGQ